MEDDEEIISNANKPHESEMKETNLVHEEIESAEQCELFPEMGVSETHVGGERDGTEPLEVNKPVATEGGPEVLLTNHVATTESEFIVESVKETIELPVIVEEEAVAVQGGGEMIVAPKGDLPAGQVRRVNDTEVASDTGNKLLSEPVLSENVEEDQRVEKEAEVAVNDTGDKLLSEPVLSENVEEDQQVEKEAEVAVNDTGDVRSFSESQFDSIGGELSTGLQVEMKPEEEVLQSHNMEAAATRAAQCSELPGNAEEDELLMMKEGMEAGDDKADREAGEGEIVEAEGSTKVGLVDDWTAGNERKTLVECDEDGKEKVGVVANDSEVRNAEKFVGIVLEKVDPVISEEVPIFESRMEEKVISEVNTDVANLVEREQNRQLAGDDMGYEGAGMADVPSEHNEVDNEEIMMPETKMEDDGEMSVEVAKDNELDEPVNTAENSEEHAEEEEFEAGDSNMPANPESENARSVADGVDDGTMDEDTKIGSVETRSDEDEPILEMDDADEPDLEMDDSPAAFQDDEDETMVAEEETGAQDTEIETETDVAESGKASGGKRKRGKLSKSPSISKSSGKASSRKTVGEDVCFICFDGGDLVLCDRRGCPKAYHPSCVNRDEAFFKAKGRWNCGWHLCSICEKNARYMCYTCTFSLCKSCTKDAVILCVRGNKGFCETCMRTVLLIENNEHGNTDTQVDFDDRSSWEFLFKDYYIELKSKLSLSSDEIAEAKNPWKGTEMSSGSNKQDSSEAQADANDGGSGSDDSIENMEIIKPKRRKVRKQSKSITKEKEMGSAGVDKANSSSDNSEWASKELLNFVSHMRDGDTSFLSQFDVQALLLEYIKRNKLRDPRRKSHIVCDARLESLFGKPRVGHFEMLKLLESHFLVRDDQNDDIQGSVVDTDNQGDTDGNVDPLNKSVKDRKRKARKKGDIRGRQSNLDDYAAIDMHNISLIYLRRKLMEDLIEDVESFNDKVVGTFVRIRISGSVQKQDLYRLVQVVGTSKGAEPYKIGKKTTDTMVEILNLDKTEVISIDTISNQEFTEEECKRLRQSIKCGLISRLTVGEILDKALEIQAARVNDWLESEVLRLSHLRDRASDLGRRKELRECVEKLQLLKTPEERRRRLEEIPEIHADPKMDPSYESDENDSETEDSRRDAFIRSRGSGFSRRGRGPISPGSDNSGKDSWSGAGKNSNRNWEMNRGLSGNNFSTNATHGSEIVNDNSWNLERDRHTQESYDTQKLNSASKSESAEWAMRTGSRSESFSGVSPVTSQVSPPASVVETAVKINESEKMWHYQDPSGKVQGPFSMAQLRKWNNTGYFPADLKIWKTTQTKENSMLLADALAGKFPKELPPIDHISPASSHILAGQSGKTSGTSFDQDRGRQNFERNPGSHSKLSLENWNGNDSTNLPSPTPKQSNMGWTGGEGVLPNTAVQSPSVNGVLPSPTAVLSDIRTTPAPASALNSVVQSGTAFSPTPNSQQGIQGISADTLHALSTMTNEPHSVQMHAHLPTAVQPIQPVITQNPQAETQVWGSGVQPGQSQGYGWVSSTTQNSSGNFSNSGTMALPQPDFWRPPAQSSQPNMHPPAAPNSTWGMGAENSNAGWGMVQASPNMGWGNTVPGNTNMNWAPTMQVPVPPPVNTTPGWVAPAGNSVGNMQGPMPGNVSSGWAPSQGWGGQPVQGPVPGNGWVPPSGNPAAPAPLQGPAQGNTNQGWGAPSGNQGSWTGEQSPSGAQFSSRRGGQDRDSGYNGGPGGRPWNRQSSFGGGGSRSSKRDTICPYNGNGRCRKGSRCDYRHA